MRGGILLNNSEEIKSSGNEEAFAPRAHGGSARERGGCGVILAFLFSLSDKIAKKFRESIFGYLLSELYTAVNKMWVNGFVYSIFKGKKTATARERGRLKTTLARLCEDSLIASILSSLSTIIVHSWVRIWGLAFFSFGFVSIFVAMVRYYFVAELFREDVIVGIVTAIISVPLIASKKRVGEALLDGRLSGYIMKRILCVDESRYARDDSVSGGSYAIAFTWAAMLGMATYFIKPLALVQVLLLFMLLLLITSYPELGITMVLGVLPLSGVLDRPSWALMILVAFSLLGFAAKYIRGKRVVRVEIMDIFVVMLGALILFGGIYTGGGRESTVSAITYLVFLMMYLLVVNAYIRKTWIYRAIKITVVMSALSALVGIVRSGAVSIPAIDALISEEAERALSAVLGGGESMGTYLVLVLPLCLSEFISSEKRPAKLFYGICTVAVAACTVLSSSEDVWLGMIAACVLFMIIYNFRSIWIFVGLGVSAPMLSLILPESVKESLLDVLIIFRNSPKTRIDVWRGALRMAADNLLGGVGFGEGAFGALYPSYSVSGAEGAVHSGSLLLEILLELGIIGGAVFALIMIAYIQKCLVGLRIRRREGKSRAMIAAGLSGIVGALVVGATDYIWSDYRVFLIFWIMMGLTMALVRINENENEKENAAALMGARAAEIEFYY